MSNYEISAHIWHNHYYGTTNKYPTFNKYLHYFHANSLLDDDTPYTAEDYMALDLTSN